MASKRNTSCQGERDTWQALQRRAPKKTSGGNMFYIAQAKERGTGNAITQKRDLKEL